MEEKPKKQKKKKRKSRKKRNPDVYQVILTKNKKKHLVIKEYSEEIHARRRFEKIKNQKVDFPKEIAWSNQKLYKLKMECLLVKKIKRKRDEKTKKAKGATLNSNEWILMDFCDYFVEDTFKVTGIKPLRLTAMEIYEHLLLKNLSDINFKQILIINNKIIIDGERIHLVMCKNTSECFRLYNFLRLKAHEEKNINLFFMGTIKITADRGEWYEKLTKITKIPKIILYRKWSR